jgi:hypothetical protein
MRNALAAIAAAVCAGAMLNGWAAAEPRNPGESWAEQRADGGLELSIKLSPQSVNLVSQADGDWMTVHTDMPYALVDTSTLELSGIPAAVAYADDRGNLVAKFGLADVEAIVEPPAAELTLTGLTADGAPFAGSDVLQVLDPQS